MFARLQCTGGPLPQLDDAEAMQRKVVEVISGHPGFAGLYLMDQLGSGRRVMLTLWRSRDEATAASARTRAELGPRPFELEVDDLRGGRRLVRAGVVRGGRGSELPAVRDADE